MNPQSPVHHELLLSIINYKIENEALPFIPTKILQAP